MYTLYTSTLSLVSDVSAGSQRACIVTGLIWPEERLQTEKPGDRPRAEEGGMH